MTPSQLKALHLKNNPESHFFDRETMAHFGDTMKNFRVDEEWIEESPGVSMPVYLLSRKRGRSTEWVFDEDGNIRHDLLRKL